jgi:hypothetical protein
MAAGVVEDPAQAKLFLYGIGMAEGKISPNAPANGLAASG